MISYGVMPVSRCGTYCKIDFDAGARAAAHLARRTREAGGAHVLDADDRAGLHRFQARFEQQFLQERIAHLHVGPLLLGFLGELGRRHGCAVDPVAAGFCANVNDRVAEPVALP